MRPLALLTTLLSGALVVQAFAGPSRLAQLDDGDGDDPAVSLQKLWKRKGGGGGGRSGGGTSSTGGTSSSASSAGRTSSSSNTGGSTSAGSGTPRSYGGGRFYGGGATTPFTSGQRTPKGLAPVALLGAGGLVFFSGAWLYGAYLYPFSRPYSFYNATARANQTKPVSCLCQQYSVCGCDDNEDSTYLDGVVGNGTALDSTLVRAVNVNGTDQIFLNGTLENGTTAAGGSDSGAGSAEGRSLAWAFLGCAVAVGVWAL